MARPKLIICVDKDGKEFQVPVNKLNFRPSVYGIIIENNHLLLSKHWDGYDLPGGAVELGETLQGSLLREIFEETGVKAKIESLIAAETSFFKFPIGKKNFFQSILLYYKCEKISGQLTDRYLAAYEKDYIGKPEWVSLKNLRNVKFYSSVDLLKIIEKAVALK